MKNLPFRVPRFASSRSGLFGALGLAAAFALIGNVEFWFPTLRVEYQKRSPITVRVASSTYLRSDVVKPQYLERWFLVRVGEKITETDRFRLINSYLNNKKEVLWYRLATFFLSGFLLSLLFSQSLRLSWPGRRRYLSSELTCYFLMLISLVGMKIFLLFTSLPFTLMPLAAVPATAVFFLGRRIGVMVCLMCAFMAGMLLDADLIALLYFLGQGLVIHPILKYSRHGKPFFTASLLITACGLVMIAALTFIFSCPSDTAAITSWRISQMLAAIGSGVLSYPTIWFLYFITRPMLGIISQAKLNEMQELQHPLLKKLQEEAPATWEHSRIVADLAEEAASKIGVDALLVRVGAYFHDIGKGTAPHYFAENYTLDGKEGEDPHKNLPPEESAKRIIDHVIEGVKILRGNAIPERIVECVYMHHGTSVVEYFWHKYQEESTSIPEEKRLGKLHFTYPGLRPQSPETAILMLADGVEAASRTLNTYTMEEIQKLINHIVMTKLLEGQLDDSGLSMENLRTVVKSLADAIHFSHHSRIKYQWQEEKKKE